MDSPSPGQHNLSGTIPRDHRRRGTRTSAYIRGAFADACLQLFFRMSIVIERTSSGFRPNVNVDFMNYVPAESTLPTNVWLLFAGQLELMLLREIDHAFRRIGATRPDGA